MKPTTEPRAKPAPQHRHRGFAMSGHNYVKGHSLRGVRALIDRGYILFCRSHQFDSHSPNW